MKKLKLLFPVGEKTHFPGENYQKWLPMSMMTAILNFWKNKYGKHGKNEKHLNNRICTAHTF